MCEMSIATLTPGVHVAAVPVINQLKEPGVGPKIKRSRPSPGSCSAGRRQASSCGSARRPWWSTPAARSSSFRKTEN